jgi:hypothetical protein
MKFLFGIGVEKCGTTSLNAALKQSSRFNTPDNKETFYFSHYYSSGPAYYESLYPRPFRSVDGYNVDITPMYFRRVEALARIESFPHPARILLSLRCPVQRAWSAYLQEVRNQVAAGNRSETFSVPMNAGFVHSFEQRNPYFFTRYADLVRNTRRRFGAENSLVLVFEEMQSNWTVEAARLDQFCGFDTPVAVDLEFPHANPSTRLPRIFDYIKEANGTITMAQKIGGRVRVYYDLDEDQLGNALRLQDSFDLEVGADVEQEIRDYFRTDVAAVEELLDRDLGFWLQRRCPRTELEDATAADRRRFRVLRRKGAREQSEHALLRRLRESRVWSSRAGGRAKAMLRRVLDR